MRPRKLSKGSHKSTILLAKTVFATMSMENLLNLLSLTNGFKKSKTIVKLKNLNSLIDSEDGKQLKCGKK